MIKRLTEKLFLKKRYVLQGFSDQLIKPFNEAVVEQYYDFFIVSRLRDLKGFTQYQESITHSFSKGIERRIYSGNWCLFLLFDKRTKQVAAKYWAFFSKETNLWHDNFIITKNSALLCNAYVDKSHRGNGLYKYLINKSHQYLFDIKAHNAFTIVEASNIASLQANISSGLHIVLCNNLFKFFTINILATYKQNNHTKLAMLGPVLGKRVLYKTSNLF